MTAIKKLISVFAAVVTVAAVHAQQIQAPAANNAVEPSSPGLIGKRYVAAGFAYTDVKHSTTDAYTVATAVNVPTTSFLDLTASYGHGWVEGNGKNNVESLDLGATAYCQIANVKPFASASLGYIWPKYISSRFTYGFDAGAEIAVFEKTSVTVSGGYQDTFKKGNVGTWDGTVAVNYWATKDIVLGVTFSLIEKGDTLYGATVGYRF